MQLAISTAVIVIIAIRLIFMAIFACLGTAIGSYVGAYISSSALRVFFGYMLISLYARKFVPVSSLKKTLAFCVPLFVAGLAIMAGGFYLRIPGGGIYPVHAPYAAAVDLEMSIEYCSLGVVAATVAIFILARKFTADGVFYRRVVLPVSEASFGAYLVHILVLVPVSSALKGMMPMPLCVFTVAAVTFVVSAIASCALRRLPVVGKWLVG